MAQTQQNEVKIVDINLAARSVIPVCIEVCRPICAQSAYTIGIDIFNRPVVQITLNGQTRIFNCDETT
jgi:hypothetical protein